MPSRMSFNGITHWGATEWKHLGGALLLCSALTDLWLLNSSLGNEGMEAFASKLHRSCAPQLEVLYLGGSNVGRRGCIALAKALGRGAMPALKTVAGVCDALSDVAQSQII
eukprot:2251073-Rhodomonas_salina.1